MKTGLFLFLASLLIAMPTRGRSAVGPPVASPPANLVLGDFSGATLSSFTCTVSMALDATSGKLFVSSRYRILRFSSQAQYTNGGFPEAVLASNGFDEIAGLAVDAAGRLWAASNNRVIRFNNAAFRPDAPEPDAVLGQPDLTSNAAAGGQSGMNGPKSLALDSSGCLWVADTGNNRVVGFLNAAAKSNGAPADLLLGQPNWTNTGSGVAASRMTLPKGLAVDGTGRLWVVDKETRALRFNNATSKLIGAPADGVLGHSDFFGTLPADPAARFMSRGVATDSAGRLFISSGGVLRFDNPWAKPNGAAPNGKFIPSPGYEEIPGDFGGNGLCPGPDGSLWVLALRTISLGVSQKILFRMDTPATATGNVLPAGILGAVNLSVPPTDTALSKPGPVLEDPQTGKVFVVDTFNSRVLRYPSAKFLNSGAPPEAVFGQPDFLTNSPGTGPAKMNRPLGIALDNSGNLWISDSGNRRVLRFANAISSAGGTPAVAALGQPDLTTNSSRPPSEFSLSSPGSLALGPDGELWVIELSQAITKVIRYDKAAAAPTGTAASGLLGRVDFYDQQSPATSSSTVFRGVQSIFCEPSGRLWVMSIKSLSNEDFDLYRFEAPSVKSNGAPAESTVTLSLASTAAIPLQGANQVVVLSPSFFIRPDGSIVLGFDSLLWNFRLPQDLRNYHVLGIAAAASLPATVNSPSQADYILKMSSIPERYGATVHYSAISPSAEGSLWISDGSSAVYRFNLPPYPSAIPSQPQAWDLTASSGGGVLALRLATIPGRDYQLYTSPGLSQWRPGQKLSATGATTVFLNTPASGRGFFKVMLLP